MNSYQFPDHQTSENNQSERNTNIFHSSPSYIPRCLQFCWLEKALNITNKIGTQFLFFHVYHLRIRSCTHSQLATPQIALTFLAVFFATEDASNLRESSAEHRPHLQHMYLRGNLLKNLTATNVSYRKRCCCLLNNAYAGRVLSAGIHPMIGGLSEREAKRKYCAGEFHE